MATPCECIHVRKPPDDGCTVRHRREERQVVEIVRNPVEIDDVAGRKLSEKLSCIVTPVITKWFVARRSRSLIGSEITRDSFPSEPALQARHEISSWCKFYDS